MIRLSHIIQQIISETLNEYTDEEKARIGIPPDTKSSGGKWYYKSGQYAGHVKDGKFVSAAQQQSSAQVSSPAQQKSPHSRRQLQRKTGNPLSAHQQYELNSKLLPTKIFDAWNDENNPYYGKPPADAPTIDPVAFLQGAISETPLQGVHQDIDISEIDLPAKLKRIGGALSPKSMESREITTDGSEQISDYLSDLQPDIFLDLLDTLSTWQGDNHDRGMDGLLEQISDSTGGRVKLDAPLLRGVSLRAQDTDEFMETFEVGSAFEINDLMSFTTDGNSVGYFTRDKYESESANAVSVIIRMHPAKDGTHSGVYIPDVTSAMKSASNNLNMQGDTKVEDMLEASEDFQNEREFLPAKNSTYTVLGRVRVVNNNRKRGVPMAPDNREEFAAGMKIIIVDVQENSNQTSEAKLPNSPKLSSPAKKLNKVAVKYLTQPMNPNKLKSNK